MEALILYFVLFFPGAYGFSLPAGEIIPFSALRELSRTLTYTVPSLALLWYLITDKKGFSSLNLNRIKPGKPEVYSLAAGLPGLIIISLFASLLDYFLSQPLGLSAPPKVEGPSTVPGFIVLVFSCLGTGYLEESYFRYYLLTKLETAVPAIPFRIAVSTLLFSLCHLYEGPWGVANALLAGVFLSILFIRYRSIHGIAWAHGAYNLFVYVMSLVNFSN